MAQRISIPAGSTREKIYNIILPRIDSVISGEKNYIANLANTAAVLKEALGFFWVGFYLREGSELVLGPFQGPLACTRIKIGSGVCGKSAEQQKTLIVPDVDTFPGHIACSTSSKSEIVVPLIAGEETKLVLDIDSSTLNDFSSLDGNYLEKVILLIKNHHFSS